MKNPGTHLGHKEQARQRAEQRTRSHQTPANGGPNAPSDMTTCDKCGAVYSRKTWRRSAARSLRAMTAGAAWGRCPACRRLRPETAVGTVVLTGASVSRLEPELRRRIAHVAERAAFTQPERKLIGLRRLPDGLEALTTSQELAHRIAREVEKAFGGRTTYSWSDRDGHLLARWDADEPGPGGAPRT
jgi:NMD protein affecting ribosome stability and mRNA decay